MNKAYNIFGLIRYSLFAAIQHTETGGGHFTASAAVAKNWNIFYNDLRHNFETVDKIGLDVCVLAFYVACFWNKLASVCQHLHL